MKGFEDHDIRLTTDLLINGLPAKSFYKWQARCIIATASYNTCSPVLSFLQMVNLSQTTTAPNRTTIAKMRLHNTCVHSSQSFFWQN